MKYRYEKPVNMPRGSHYGSDYWIAKSYKLHRNVCLYSMLEYANYLELEMNPDVEYFCEQPVSVELLVGSKMRETVFDFWVIYTDSREEFQEVKYQADLEGTEKSALRSQEQIKRQENWCKINEFSYKVITDQVLYEHKYRSLNLSLLSSYINRFDTYFKCNLYLENLKKYTSQPVAVSTILTEGILEPTLEWVILAHLYYAGKIEININDRPLDISSEVKIIGN